MRGHEPDPFDARDPADLVKQFGKAHRLSQRLPVGIHVLPKKHDLDHAVLCQAFDLAEDVLRFAASFPPAHVGHDAVGAEIVAAEHDVDARFPWNVALYGQVFDDAPFFIPDLDDAFSAHHPLVQDRCQPINVVGSEDNVHETVFRPDLFDFILFLHHAAADPDDFVRMLAFHAVEVPKMTVQARIRVLPHRAGVENDDVRLFTFRSFKSCREEDPPQLFGVPFVHLTAERDHTG